MLVAAAIKHKKTGKVYVGARHHLIFQMADGLGSGIQGFVTDKGEFLDREEGLKHVENCGQFRRKIADVLTSEELW